MNIIEREIQKREDLIAERENKLQEAEQLLAQANELKAKYETVNPDTLRTEIDELKAYIARPAI